MKTEHDNNEVVYIMLQASAQRTMTFYILPIQHLSTV